MKTRLFLGIIGALWAMNANTANKGEAAILDVRTPAEYAESHLKDSVNLDFLNSSFKEEVSKLPRDKEYLVYCRSGNRSRKAIEVMKSLGFTRVKNLGSLEEAAKELKAKCEGKIARC